jgi:IclR family transcriptional regulator, acetate operon repressor
MQQAPADSTTHRVISVLLAFSRASAALGVSDISRQTGLSKAVVHRILQELAASGMVVQSDATRRYSLGSAAFALANAAGQQSTLRAAGMPVVARLMEQTDETVTLSARSGYRRIYLGQVESSQMIRISIQVGLNLPLTVGASGHAMLAFLPEPEIDDILSHPVPALNERTETRPKVIRARLAEVRRHGFASTHGERVAEAISFAAPIFDGMHEVAGAISIGALASRVDETRARYLSTQVMAAAQEITEILQPRS